MPAIHLGQHIREVLADMTRQCINLSKPRGCQFRGASAPVISFLHDIQTRKEASVTVEQLGSKH